MYSGSFFRTIDVGSDPQTDALAAATSQAQNAAVQALRREAPMTRRRRIQRRAPVLAVTLLIMVHVGPPVLAQVEEDHKVLNLQVVQLYQAGKYNEALPIAQRRIR